jgi:hypothetical protein
VRGCWPLGTGTHCPAELHTWQAEVQAALQQTPSGAQNRPVWHWLTDVHAPPIAFCAMHCPVVQ